MTFNLTGDWLTAAGNKRAVHGTIDFDSSYPTNGESFSPAQMGLGVVDHINIAPTAGYVFQYDYANSKIKAFYQTDPANAGGANIALIEVANATNLSSVTGVHFQAFGR